MSIYIHTYIHTYIHVQSMGWIPGQSERVKDLDTWIKGLNEWASKEVDAYKKGPQTGLNSKVYTHEFVFFSSSLYVFIISSITCMHA